MERHRAMLHLYKRNVILSAHVWCLQIFYNNETLFIWKNISLQSNLVLFCVEQFCCLHFVWLIKYFQWDRSTKTVINVDPFNHCCLMCLSICMNLQTLKGSMSGVTLILHCQSYTSVNYRFGPTQRAVSEIPLLRYIDSSLYIFNSDVCSGSGVWIRNRSNSSWT